MKRRILVRTIFNVSYIGALQSTDKFHDQGVAVEPNPNLSMQMFIPADEILEIVDMGKKYGYNDYMKEMNREVQL